MIHSLNSIVSRLDIWSSTLPTNVLVGLHFAINSFGVLGFYYGVQSVFVDRYKIDTALQALDSIKYFNWISPYYFPVHKYTLYAYAIAITILGLIFLVMLVCTLKTETNKLVNRSAFPWIYLADLLIVIFMVIINLHGSPGYAAVLISIILWVAVMAVPFFHLSKQIPWVSKSFSPQVLIVLFTIDFVVCFAPFISGQALFLNDYADEIPSQTWVRSSPKDPAKLVDNIQYINSNLIDGTLYDPRVSPGEDPLCLPEDRVDSTQSNLLKNLFRLNRDKFYVRYPTGEICYIGDSGVSPKSKISEEQIDFINKNRFEMSHSHEQLANIFHHHFQLLNPIKELALGRPIREVVSLYGLSFVPVSLAMKYTGGINYNSFLTIFFSSYLVYFACFVGMLVVVFRDLRYVAIVFLLALACVKALGYIAIFVGIGFAPLRHFHDIFVIFFLFLYLKKSHFAWLFAALAAALAGILLDRMYGSFGILAFFAVLIVRMAVDHGREVEKWTLFLGIPAYAFLFWFTGQAVAPSPYVGSIFDGILGFYVSGIKIGLFFVGFISAKITLVYLMKRHFDQMLYLSLFLVLYMEALLFYWLSIPERGHLLAILPVAILAIASIMRFGLPAIMSVRAERSSVMAALLFAGVISLLASLQFWGTMKSIQEVEANHKIFEWPFKNTQIRSTMDPALFNEASQLIQRWSPQSGVHIISRFDTLITWLSEKYSLMPHSDMISYLNGPVAHAKVVSVLRTERPDLLFVDSCIECNFVTSKPNTNYWLMAPHLHDGLALKIGRLNQLQDVFRDIKDDYELVERGALISVYKLKRAY